MNFHFCSHQCKQKSRLSCDTAKDESQAIKMVPLSSTNYASILSPVAPQTSVWSYAVSIPFSTTYINIKTSWPLRVSHNWKHLLTVLSVSLSVQATIGPLHSKPRSTGWFSEMWRWIKTISFAAFSFLSRIQKERGYPMLWSLVKLMVAVPTSSGLLRSWFPHQRQCL